MEPHYTCQSLIRRTLSQLLSLFRQSISVSLSPTIVSNNHKPSPQKMAANDSPPKQTPKKANLLDPSSIKHLLDESVSEIVKIRGYPENVTLSNVKLLIGAITIAIALVAQFYPKKFPDNSDVLIGCIGLYVVFNVMLQVITYTLEKDAIVFTHPPNGSFTSTGIVVSSKMPKFSDMYTLTITSSDPKSISAGKQAELTKSVTKWFTKDGILVEGLFWKDVNNLISEYAGESVKKSK